MAFSLRQRSEVGKQRLLCVHAIEQWSNSVEHDRRHDDRRYNVAMKTHCSFLDRPAVTSVHFFGRGRCQISASKTTVELKDAQGKSVGMAVISNESKAPSGVIMKLKLHDLPPGEHALHFHAKAQCDAPDFKSAGPHFNPEGKKARPGETPRATTPRYEQLQGEREWRAKLRVVNKDVSLGDDSHSLFSNGGASPGHPCQGG